MIWKWNPYLMRKISGELLVSLPALIKGVAAPIVVGENGRLVEPYIANLIKRFGCAH